MASKRTAKSSSSGEVFQKAMLSLSSDLTKECTKGKQKRKERLPKPKSTGQKATTSRRQKNHLSQTKTKTQMMNKENDKGSEKVAKSSIAEKLNLLRNPKVISSEPITNTKRKVLGTIQSSHVGSGGVKPASTTTSVKVDKDLRRVLAHSEEEKLSSTSTSDSKSKRIKKGSAVATCESSNESSRQRRGDNIGNGSKQIETSKPSPSESGSDMDSSPRTAGVPLREISLRLVEGLQTPVIFPESSYLDNVKAELKKLMKQSDPEAYAQLMLCISDRHEDTPVINAAILAAQQDTTTDSTGSFNILQPSGFFDDSNSLPADCNPLQTLFDTATDSIPPDPTTTAPTHSSIPMQSSTSGQHCDASSLLPPILHPVSTAVNPVTHLNISPTPFHLPTVILHPDIEPSTADNLLSQPPLMDNSHMSFTSAAAPPSVDFLDYLDAGSLDSASDVQYSVALATGPGGEECNHGVGEGGNPAHHWVMASPDRPRMFPRKLY